MSYAIKTNKIEYDLNWGEIKDKFEVFTIRTSKDYFSRGAYVIDVPLGVNNVHSVLFESGKCIYVLMNKDVSNKMILKEALSNVYDAEYISLHQEHIETVQDEIILQLLLNSLSNYQSEGLKFNNLTGHFYCFHPGWLKHRKVNGADEIVQVPCMEVKITSDFRLKLTVSTFTSELLKSKIEFNKKQFYQYPKYVFSANNTLRRKLADDQDRVFIKRQIKGKKASIPFLGLSSLENFEQSKMGLLNSIVQRFNTTFGKYAVISFYEIDDYKSEDYTTTVKKENEASIKAALDKLPVKIVDDIDDTYSGLFCKEIRNTLKEKYDVESKIGKRVSKDHLNIRLIHNKEYYQGENDPHDQEFPGIAVQHITFEDFTADSQFAVKSVLHEVLIKEDLRNGKITLFDWNSLTFDGPVTFGIAADSNGGDKYAFMDILPDGTFELTTEDYNPMHETCHSDMMLAMEDMILAEESFKGMIKFADGTIIVIKDTGWFTIPEIEKIYRELSSGNTKIRGEEMRKELLTACLDIKCFEDENSDYYFVGTKQKGLPRTIQVAANIRKVERVQGNDSKFAELLPLMNVSFVHNGQLTVMPFPFKYLREYGRGLK